MENQEKTPEMNAAAADNANLNTSNAPASAAPQPAPQAAPQAAPQQVSYANPVYPQGMPQQGVQGTAVYPQGAPMNQVYSQQGVAVNQVYPQGMPQQGAYPYAQGAMPPGMQPQVTVYVNNPPPQQPRRKVSWFGVFLLFLFPCGLLAWAIFRYKVYCQMIKENSFSTVDPLERFFKEISQTGDLLANSNSDVAEFLIRVFADDLFKFDFSSNLLPPLAITTLVLFCAGAFLLLVTLGSVAAFSIRRR